MNTSEKPALLGLSKKEEKVLSSLQDGVDTPLSLARATGVSRTAIYAILGNLKKRGLAHTRIVGGKKYWSLAPEREIEEVVYEAKRALLKIPEGREEVYGLSDSTVIIHRGQDSIRKVFGELLFVHKNERFYGLVGDSAAANWNKMFSLQETNRFNRALKRNNIIAETITQDGLLERQARELGVSWAKDFEGRTTRVNVIDGEYFAHGAQIFIFKQSIYLMALGEDLVIEIRNSEIQKMLLTFFKFMQDNSRVIDANALLRSIIAEIEDKK
ncbi:MAG: winged helix-turn-helix domain-containing protein [Candidatus Kaiserbacteria bacterium]|nr:winged helix-turn-helix domain-containing protein [Candidatus Kaiserbacteria bacterium]